MKHPRPVITEANDLFFILTFPDIDTSLTIYRSRRVVNAQTGNDLTVHPISGLVVCGNKRYGESRCISVDLYIRKAYERYIALVSHEDKREISHMGFPGYWVTRDGRLWTDNKCMWVSPVEKDGIYYVTPSNSRVMRSKELHRLVALCFCKNPRNYRYVRFNDGNGLNCHASNLTWVKSHKPALRSNHRGEQQCLSVPS